MFILRYACTSMSLCIHSCVIYSPCKKKKSSKTSRDNIVLPVELTVLEGGLFPSPDHIDFGTLSSQQEGTRNTEQFNFN